MPADPQPVRTGTLLWTPPAERAAASRLGRWLSALRGAGTLPRDSGYDEAHAWSVGDPGAFWPAVADELGIAWSTPPERVLDRGPDGVEGARWFAGGRLNYARLALHPPGVADDDLAVIARSEAGPERQLTWAELRAEVGRVAAGLAEAGVGAGDTVAGYLPNGPEAVVGLLAAATLGARWTCCAPEMGAAGVLDRLGQVSPAVLVAADGYVWNGRAIDRGDEAAAIADGLPSLRQRVWVTHRDTAAPAPPGWRPWADLGAGAAAPDPCEVAADHPLHVLYSSGTTGRPKAIVHGHAGIALEHAKALALHFDLGPGDRFCWYTTTGWMMWNFLVSGLLVGATVVCYDGAPGDLWRLFAETGTTVGGMGAAALAASEKAGRRPADEVDLSSLRTLGSTGSPLAASTAAWVYDAVKADVALGSFSGGTDVCTGFVGPSPLHPVWAGEISCACLGAAVGVVDDAGRPVVGVEGELVLTAPLPSMPLEFVADPGGHRLHDAYYATFPRLWDHGDRATLTERGTLAITGRSDGTLNRGGVRMGTAELYGVVEALDGVADSLAVHLEATDELWLFVVAADDAGLDERIRAALRSRLSPRHVPDRIVRVPAVPRTLSGKKLEVPVKRLLAGADLADVVALAAVANPAAFDAIVAARPG